MQYIAQSIQSNVQNVLNVYYTLGQSQTIKAVQIVQHSKTKTHKQIEIATNNNKIFLTGGKLRYQFQKLTLEYNPLANKIVQNMDMN